MQKMKKLENGPNFECRLKKLKSLFSTLAEKAEIFMEYEIGGFLKHLEVRRFAVHIMFKLLGFC